MKFCNPIPKLLKYLHIHKKTHNFLKFIFSLYIQWLIIIKVQGTANKRIIDIDCRQHLPITKASLSLFVLLYSTPATIAECQNPEAWPASTFERRSLRMKSSTTIIQFDIQYDIHS